ncbi:2Fe-2S iron-sulfur cluster-binding protein [Jannaschia sp. CCS1]|uniref:2Fe-2S iron-sulfur cluster-binding protein n=1 Tax=Jannaschia sp. (strain CCS1) TaxID=290400 RepID=UPI000053C006|nr:2Fe-2S iron-sulfur cluster-binding protein [Jannaschia sp. CCS1]ABD53568.1 phenylacetic acid degradation oxidoreductase PaaK [Jannaschia sp. CCS1]
MAKFIPLTVTRIHRTTSDAVSVQLAPQDGSTLPFTQGQYLTFRQEIDGVELRRAYSISAGITDGTLEVGIKKVQGGAFSTWANETLQEGDTIDALSPMGTFHTPLRPEARTHYLGFAIGSGITPVLSILRSTLAVEPESRFTLIYANRTARDVMFREELEDLKNENLTRLNIVHILKNDPTGIDLFTGRIDAKKLDAMFAQWVDVDTADAAFICGPEAAMETIADRLAHHGMASDAIKYELFAASQQGQLPQTHAPDDTSASTTATIIVDGTAQDVDVAPNETILAAALRAGLDAPYACRAGVCSTCMCRVVDGEAQMITNHALEDYEVARGMVLSCQALPVGPSITVEYQDH